MVPATDVQLLFRNLCNRHDPCELAEAYAAARDEVESNFGAIKSLTPEQKERLAGALDHQAAFAERSGDRRALGLRLISLRLRAELLTGDGRNIIHEMSALEHQAGTGNNSSRPKSVQASSVPRTPAGQYSP